MVLNIQRGRTLQNLIQLENLTQSFEALKKVKELWKHGTSGLWLGVPTTGWASQPSSQTQPMNTANSWWNRPSILYWLWVNHMIFEIKIWKIVPWKEPVIWLYDFPYYESIAPNRKYVLLRRTKMVTCN